MTQGWPRRYCVWRCINPTPNVPIASLEVLPAGARFLIAGLTLGLTDQDPFLREPAVPVRIELKDPQLAKRPLGPDAVDLRLVVDRGVAGYAYPLPQQSSDEFLTDRFAGGVSFRMGTPVRRTLTWPRFPLPPCRS